MVRTILADYIQNIPPQLSGVVNTNGNVVTWVSGDEFSYLLNGVPILINGVALKVQSNGVQNAQSLLLTASAGVQNGVPFSVAMPTGDIFADTQAYVVPTIVLAWRRLQKAMAKNGHSRLRSEVLITGAPVMSNLDPAAQQWMDWTGFFDGTSFLTTATNPVGPNLPQDFIQPVRLWERPSGLSVEFRPMELAGDGLIPRNKGSYNHFFDWREDAIYFPGSLLSMDFKILYSAFLPDIVVGTGQTFDQVQIPIMRAAESLAYYAAEIFVTARGGKDLAEDFRAKGEEATGQIVSSQVKLQARSSFHRRPWGFRGRRNRLR